MEHRTYFPKRQRINKIKAAGLKLSSKAPICFKLNRFDYPQTKLLFDETEVYEFNRLLNQKPLLPGAFAKYKDACECGQRYENNCAHFLSKNR